MPARQPRDWIQISVTALPGLAAVIALIFTWVAVNATNNQLQITEQGQITDRYNAAITNLGSASIDVRLGGIYALQRLMQDSPRDQSTLVAVLCAFVRDHTKSPYLPPAPNPGVQVISLPIQPPTDVQAALTVVGTRDTAHDGSTTVVDFTDVNFSDLNLDGMKLVGADLSRAILTNVDFSGADLTNADLVGADLVGADLVGADLTNANLTNANLTNANLTHTSLTGANLTGTQRHPN